MQKTKVHESKKNRIAMELSGKYRNYIIFFFYLEGPGTERLPESARICHSFLLPVFFRLYKMYESLTQNDYVVLHIHEVTNNLHLGYKIHLIIKTITDKKDLEYARGNTAYKY